MYATGNDAPDPANRHRKRPLTDSFAMGGYAVYVWTAYGFAAVVLIALLVQSWRSARRRDAELEQVRRVVRPARTSRPKPQPGQRAERPSDAELVRPATE
jgi:heme exporter protein D